MHRKAREGTVVVVAMASIKFMFSWIYVWVAVKSQMRTN